MYKVIIKYMGLSVGERFSCQLSPYSLSKNKINPKLMYHITTGPLSVNRHRFKSYLL